MAERPETLGLGLGLERPDQVQRSRPTLVEDGLGGLDALDA